MIASLLLVTTIYQAMNEPSFKETVLRCPFSVVDGSIAMVTTQPTLMPAEASQKLAWVLGGKVSPLKDLQSLAGHVRISSAKDALAYVRLLTSPTTFHAWYPSRRVEVMTREASKDPALYFGLRSGIPSTRLSDGYCGIVSESTMKELGLKPASVAPNGSDYLVDRFVIEEKDYTSPLAFYRYQESVGPSGQYRLLKKTKLSGNTKLAKVNWYVPRYE